jgi:hypothetical protein
MKKLTLIAALWAVLLNATAQCSFIENFQSPSNWTTMGDGKVYVNPASQNIVFNDAHSTYDSRVLKALPCGTVSGYPWTLEFKITPTGTGGAGSSAYIALTANSNDPTAEPAYGSVFSTWTPNTMLKVEYSSAFGAAPSQSFFVLAWRDQAPIDYNTRIFSQTAPLNGSPYYVRLERRNATDCSISYFSDANFSVPTAGGAVCFTVPSNINNFNYIQVGMSAEGHPSRTMTATIDDITMTPALKTAPPITSIRQNGVLCGGNVGVQLAVSGNASFAWSNGSTSASTVVNQAGVYTVTATNASGCTYTESITVVNAVIPTPIITTQGNILGIYNIASNQTYQWYQNGNPIAGANTANYTITGNGLYHVCTSNAAGCQTCSAPIFSNYLGTEQPTWANAVRITPNPTQNFVLITGLPSQKHQINVYNVLGQTLQTLTNTADTYHLEMDNWAAGAYIIRIEDTVWKVVKE